MEVKCFLMAKSIIAKKIKKIIYHDENKLMKKTFVRTAIKQRQDA